MEVILLDRVKNLGTVGDRVTVKAGYGRNFLLPKRLAVPANAANVAEFEARRAEHEAAAAAALSAAQERGAAIEALSVEIAAKAGTEGKLFGSVTNREVADAIVAAGVQVEKMEVRMGDLHIREVGEYEIGLHLHSDVDASITVTVVAEEE